MAVRHKAFKSVAFNMLYFYEKRQDPFQRDQNFHLYVESLVSWDPKATLWGFLSLGSHQPLFFLFEPSSHWQFEIDDFIAKRSREKNPLIAFKLIYLYCCAQERADRSRKSSKSIVPLCLLPATIHRTPTLPLWSGLLELSSQDSPATTEGTDTSLITPAISAGVIKQRCR